MLTIPNTVHTNQRLISKYGNDALKSTSDSDSEEFAQSLADANITSDGMPELSNGGKKSVRSAPAADLQTKEKEKEIPLSLTPAIALAVPLVVANMNASTGHVGNSDVRQSSLDAAKATQLNTGSSVDDMAKSKSTSTDNSVQGQSVNVVGVQSAANALAETETPAKEADGEQENHLLTKAGGKPSDSLVQPMTISQLPSAGSADVTTSTTIATAPSLQSMGTQIPTPVDDGKTKKNDVTTVLPPSMPVTAAQTSSTVVPLPPPAPIPQIAQQLVAQATMVKSGQSTEMRLRLRPPELGDVSIIMRRDATGALTTTLIPATQAAYAALQANMHHLRAVLVPHSQGAAPDVQLMASGQQFQSNGQGNFQSQQQTSQYTGTVGAGEFATTPVVTVPITARRSHGLVDYDA